MAPKSATLCSAMSSMVLSGRGLPSSTQILPADVGRDPVRLESRRLEHPQGLRQHHLTDSVTGHHDDLSL